ncbi:MAG: DcaP family trimeric outer membrane transporter [Pseudoxanthomonas sp.]
MSKSIVTMARRPLAAALFVALLAPGLALGQTKKEKELEARIAQLEAQVQALLGAQQQQQTQIADTQAQVADTKTQLDQVKVAATPAGKQPIQNTTILPAGNPNSTFSYGGFIKFDAMITDTSDGAIADGSSGRLFYVPSTIPVTANGAEPDSDPYTDFHAQFSRFWLSADHVTDNGDKLKGYVEMDFFGGGSNALAGNEVATNTYAVTLRQAYVSWNNWLAGQTWSNFQDTAALPDAVDFVGVTEGTTFVRQAQIRYTKGNFSVSAENPQTTVSDIATAARTNGTGANTLPDLTARWVTKGDWGHFSVAGLLRQFKLGEENETGAAISLSGKFNLGASDDIRWMANYGSGLGRYMAFGLGPDTAVDINGNLHAVDAAGGFVAWRHVFSPKLRTNLMYSVATYDNDRGLPGWGAGSYAATERAESFHANVIYSPLPKLDVGAEIGYGKRELEDNREGDLKRFQTTVKYSF